MNQHWFAMDKDDEKGIFTKHWTETRGHKLKVEQVDVLETECLEGLRRFIEAVHTKFRRATINKTSELLNCYKK